MMGWGPKKSRCYLAEIGYDLSLAWLKFCENEKWGGILQL